LLKGCSALSIALNAELHTLISKTEQT